MDLNVLPQARLHAALIYPIKSCGAQQVSELHIDRWGGAEGDRRWAVLNADHEVTWQGEHPRLALVQPHLNTQRGLLLQAPGIEPLTIPAEAELAPREFRIWNAQAGHTDSYIGTDAGDQAADWLSTLVGAPLRLVRLPDAAVGRPTANRLHLLSLESCTEVDALLRTQGRPPADPRRYRPNLLLQGWVEPLSPFAEEHLASLTWDSGELTLQGPCLRCVMTDVDPDSADSEPGILAALASLSAQRHPGAATCLGVYGRGRPGDQLVRGQVLQLSYRF